MQDGEIVGGIVDDMFPQTVGVAIGPVPIAVVILMLFSKRARSNGLALLAD
jgi:hypothetical protein